jgi:Tol biopolymer transport system component
LKPLFARALELPAEERGRFLTEVCGEDIDLRRQLELLLDSHNGAQDFLEGPAVSADEAPVPAGIGPYNIIRELGRGGMGTVYLADDSRLRRHVALKILPPAFAADAVRLARFKQEALAVSALNHPNILTIYEVGNSAGVHYLATEYIDGETLRHRIKRGPMPAQEAVETAIQVMRALSAAHAVGIVHHDIKPENIMLRRDGYVKVLDFGIARSAPTPGETVTLTGLVMGTPAYMAPERARGRKADARADIYSFGVVLRQMISPCAAHRGLKRIIARATRPEPDERYQTASELLRDLERLRHARWRLVLPLTAALALAAASLFLYLRGTPTDAGMRMTRITGTGRVREAVISPDGRYLAYVSDGLRVREMASGGETQLAPRSAGQIRDLALPPDSRYLYYEDWAGFFDAVLYRVPVEGGPSQIVTRHVQGRISFSPDGKHFAFPRRADGQSTIVVADVQARAERVLSTVRDPGQFKHLAWSPVGDVIACAVEHPAALTLEVVPANGGSRRALGNTRSNSIEGMAWRDRANLLFTGSDAAAFWLMPVWKLTYPQGAIRRITPDVGSYVSVSVAGDRIAAVKVESSVEIALPREGTSFQVQGAGDFFDLAWTNDGRILYASDVTGTLDLWVADADGGNRRQLTRNAGANALPVVCGDGQHIIFLSNRTGEFRIWRIDRDGGGAVALTGSVHIGGGDCSPDGRRVVYTDEHGTWDIPIEGGQPRLLTAEALTDPTFSPDGAFIAGERNHRTEIIRSTGGPSLQSLKLPHFLSRVKWSPDGSGFDYIHEEDVWRQPLSEKPPTRITDYHSDGPGAFAWSRDGKRLACARVSQSGDVVMITGVR